MDDRKTILVVDDEAKITEVISSYLESRNYRVLTAQSGDRALEIFAQENIALLILDLMMPGISGEEVCQRIRRRSRLPIIMLTAKSNEKSLISGLAMGADDYIAKPFSLKELLARVEAVLRRTAPDLVPLHVRNSWRDGDLAVDFEKHLILKKGQAVNLTPSEAKILAALIKYPGKVFTREELAGIALGSDFDGYDRTVDSHIRNLRQKIEDVPRSPVYVLTVHGLGYRFGGE